MIDNPRPDSGRILASSDILQCYAKTALMYEELRAAIDDGHESMTHVDALAEIAAIQAENVELRTGYDAARLEIESLRARGVAPAMGYEHQCAIMEDERRASLDAFDPDASLTRTEERLYETAFTNGWDRAMRAAQPAGAQQPGAGTWTPLPGTLPEPGKPVLLDIGKEYPIRAMWAAKFTLPVGMEDDSGFGEHDELTDEWYCPEGWYEWNEHEECHWLVDETPVSWCELPPKEQK